MADRLWLRVRGAGSHWSSAVAASVPQATSAQSRPPLIHCNAQIVEPAAVGVVDCVYEFARSKLGLANSCFLSFFVRRCCIGSTAGPASPVNVSGLVDPVLIIIKHVRRRSLCVGSLPLHAAAVVRDAVHTGQRHVRRRRGQCSAVLPLARWICVNTGLRGDLA